MMQIEHIALWTTDIERLRAFYEGYFAATSHAKYVNAAKQFKSYFLTFETGARLEIMSSPRVRQLPVDDSMLPGGYIHIAFSLGSREQVDALTARLQQDGVPVLDGPRWTGDGYYESVLLDPDGNRIELTI
jgi:lactoylglutathione lyase